MSNRTKIVIILGVIILLAGSYISLDFSRIFLLPDDQYNVSFTIVKIFKLLTSFLCLFLAWTSLEHDISDSDSRRIRVAFSVIFLGDLSFTLNKPAIGIISFGIGQLLLIFRNANGLKKYIKNREYNDDKRYMIITGVVIVAVDIFALYFLFYRSAGLTTLVKVFSIYSITLCLSIWVAFMTKEIKYFEIKNSVMIMTGMVLFFFCDLTVGYGIILEGVLKKEIITSLTWIFYTPAIVLLALSSYKLKIFRK